MMMHYGALMKNEDIDDDEDNDDDEDSKRDGNSSPDEDITSYVCQ
jgi:hypothetical protein